MKLNKLTLLLSLIPCLLFADGGYTPPGGVAASTNSLSEVLATGDDANGLSITNLNKLISIADNDGEVAIRQGGTNASLYAEAWFNDMAARFYNPTYGDVRFCHSQGTPYAISVVGRALIDHNATNGAEAVNYRTLTNELANIDTGYLIPGTGSLAYASTIVWNPTYEVEHLVLDGEATISISNAVTVGVLNLVMIGTNTVTWSGITFADGQFTQTGTNVISCIRGGSAWYAAGLGF